MGGLIELILSYGIFLVCISMGLIGVYQSLSDQKNLYEVQDEGSRQTLERTARQDALAYATFVRNVRTSNQTVAAPGNPEDCSSASVGMLSAGLPGGFSVVLLQPASPTDGTTTNWTLANVGASGMTPLIAQLRRTSTNAIVAEEFLRC